MVDKYVITGGPGTGKTSVITELAKDYDTLSETAREIGDSVPNLNLVDDKVQYKIFLTQLKKEKNISSEILFLDRGVPDSLAYFKYHKFKIPKNVLEESRPEKTGYKIVFVMNAIPYIKDDVRKENAKEAKAIHKIIISTYRDLGYKIVEVPFMSIEERAKFIKSFLN